MPARNDPRPACGGRGRRMRRVLLLALAGVVLATAGAGAWLYRNLEGNLHSVDIDAELGPGRPSRDPAAPSRDLLVLSSDSATGEGSAMVVHLPDGTGAPTAVGIPAKLAVDRPACAGSGGPRVAFGEIHSLGGPSCLVQVVERMSDIRMDHYLEVDLAGSAPLVDALGGVTVRLEQPVHDTAGQVVLAAGSHRLDGDAALAALRATAPADATELRQRFLPALLHEVNAQDVLGSPARLYRVADAATKALTTDSALGSLSGLVDFARELGETGTGRLETVTLPVRRDGGEGKESAGVWESLRSGEPVRTASPPAKATKGTEGS